jgi:hypothetical protein
LAHINETFTFAVVDPFNHGYCPSRHVKFRSNLENLYRIFLEEPIVNLYNVTEEANEEISMNDSEMSNINEEKLIAI